MIHILVVDDDKNLNQTVQAMLWLGKQIAAAAVFVWAKISAAWRSRQQ